MDPIERLQDFVFDDRTWVVFKCLLVVVKSHSCHMHANLYLEIIQHFHLCQNLTFNKQKGFALFIIILKNLDPFSCDSENIHSTDA